MSVAARSAPPRRRRNARSPRRPRRRAAAAAAAALAAVLGSIGGGCVHGGSCAAVEAFFAAANTGRTASPSGVASVRDAPTAFAPPRCQRRLLLVADPSPRSSRPFAPSSSPPSPVVRRMSDVGGGLGEGGAGGGRPPPGGGGGGGKNGGGKGDLDDFLDEGREESENLQRARELMAEDSLPISFGFEKKKKTEEKDGGGARAREGAEDGKDEAEGGDDPPTIETRGDIIPMPGSAAGERFGGFQTPGAEDVLALAENPYLDVVSRLSPSDIISKFTATAHPRVQDAVRTTILGLIGNLPKLGFDAATVTTGERLASLMFQLQMTGYMFKNAEYRLSLTQSLGMTRPPGSYKRMAKDGFLLEGDKRNGSAALGEELAVDRDELEDDEALSRGKVKGKIRVRYGGGGAPGKKGDEKSSDAAASPEDDDDVSPPVSEMEVEVDAEAYLSELRSEVSRLRDELAVARKTKEDALRRDLLAYIRTLSRDELTDLTGTMSPDVLGAMKGLVNVVVAGIGEGRIGPDTVTEQSGEAMAQLCMWQLVVGYNLRELEVREEMRAALAGGSSSSSGSGSKSGGSDSGDEDGDGGWQ